MSKKAHGEAKQSLTIRLDPAMRTALENEFPKAGHDDISSYIRYLLRTHPERQLKTKKI